MVCIAPIKDYSDELAIKEFIYAIFTNCYEVTDLLKKSTDDTLVVIKPNWIQEYNEKIRDLWEPVITHPNLVLAVLEIVAEMMGKGTICVCDAPHTYADFNAILERGNFRERFARLKQHWPNIRFELIDLRREVWVIKEGVVITRKSNFLDPRGYVCFNLGKESLFYRFSGESRYYGADYDTSLVNDHHCGERQEYLLSGTAVKCDLLINLPKLKTHKKTGITCALKNLVGINGDKNWLPHYTKGSPENGGDECPYENIQNKLERTFKNIGTKATLLFPRVGSLIYRKIRKGGVKILGDSDEIIRNGNWHGNDTCWRMVLDINRAFLYGDEHGNLNKEKMKKYITFVDGIIGGEGNGPLSPEPVNSGVLIAGINPAEVDAVACRLMGFDFEKVPVIKMAFSPRRFPISTTPINNIKVKDQRIDQLVVLEEVKPVIESGFKPHFGWKNIKLNY